VSEIFIFPFSNFKMISFQTNFLFNSLYYAKMRNELAVPIFTIKRQAMMECIQKNVRHMIIKYLHYYLTLDKL